MKFHLLLIIFLGFNLSLFGQDFTTEDYKKEEIYIKMRDGVKLFTTIYSPKEPKEKYPVLLIRTCYSVAPYGKDIMPEKLMHNPDLVASGFWIWLFIKIVCANLPYILNC